MKYHLKMNNNQPFLLNSHDVTELWNDLSNRPEENNPQSKILYSIEYRVIEYRIQNKEYRIIFIEQRKKKDFLSELPKTKKKQICHLAPYRLY